METKTCPDCGDDISLKAKRHKCGWKQEVSYHSRGMPPEAKSKYESLGCRYIPTKHELEARRLFPKPAHGFGVWWAQRIVYLAEHGESPGSQHVEVARQVLGNDSPVTE